MKVVRTIIKALQKNQQQRLYALLFFDIVLNILDIVFLAAFIWLMQAFIQNATYGNNQLSLFIQHNLKIIIIAFCILYLVKNLLSYYNTKWQNSFAYKVAASISVRRLHKYLETGFFEYNGVHSSQQFMKISQVPIEFGHYVLRGALQAAGQLLLIVLSLSAILLYDAKLFSLLMVILLPPAMLVHLLVKKQIIKLRSRTKIAGAMAHKHLTEALDGYIESNIYNKAKYFGSKYFLSQTSFNALLAEQQSIQALPSKLMEASGISAILLLMLINKMVFGSLISVTTIGAFVAAAYRVMPAVVKLTTSFSQIRSYQHTIPEPLSGLKNGRESALEFPLQSVDKVECRHLSFKYADHWVIQDFNMVLRRGDLAGMSAPSGRGKTTLINLILGFLHPDKGEVCINNIPCLAPAFHKFSGIAYVKQSPFLINDTLAANITLEENVDKEKLEEVLYITGLYNCFASEDIAQMMISENGRNISGGQRKRIALARALYQGSDFLILDEPFSELDRESENRLVRYLQTLTSEGKIILLITHNTNILSYCNKLIYLNAAEEKGIDYSDTRVS